jgi:hypothetical protein
VHLYALSTNMHTTTAKLIEETEELEEDLDDKDKEA